MIPAVIATVFISSVSLIMADDDIFWWSSKPSANASDYGYVPDYLECGSSCSNCNETAKECFGYEWGNICYEPEKGETCCKDRFGTSCYRDYYCAYNDDNEAFCCDKETAVDACGDIFNQNLTSSERVAPTTVIVTHFLTPTATSESIMSRPNRTPPPQIDIKVPKNETASDEVLSTGAKIGIGIGSIALLAAIAGVGVFFVIRRRHARKYRQLGGNQGDKLTAQHPAPYQMHAPVPAPIHGAGTAYEPMRNDPHPPSYHQNDHKHAYMMSPPQPSVSPFLDSAAFHPPTVTASGSQQHGAEFPHVHSAQVIQELTASTAPANTTIVHEMPAQVRK